jgi:hypothetical protein
MDEIFRLVSEDEGRRRVNNQPRFSTVDLCTYPGSYRRGPGVATRRRKVT